MSGTLIARVTTMTPGMNGVGHAAGFDFVSVAHNTVREFDMIGKPVPQGISIPAGVPTAVRDTADGQQILALQPFERGVPVALPDFMDAVKGTQGRYGGAQLHVADMAADTKLVLRFPADEPVEMAPGGGSSFWDQLRDFPS